jgi:hypothetical protein
MMTPKEGQRWRILKPDKSGNKDHIYIIDHIHRDGKACVLWNENRGTPGNEKYMLHYFNNEEKWELVSEAKECPECGNTGDFDKDDFICQKCRSGQALEGRVISTVDEDESIVDFCGGRNELTIGNITLQRRLVPEDLLVALKRFVGE